MSERSMGVLQEADEERARMSRQERDRQLAKLRAQARPDIPADEDWA